MVFRQQRNFQFEIQNVPIYDNSVTLYTNHIVESLPEPHIGTGDFKFYYTFTADVNGELNIPFGSRDEGHLFLLDVRARDYDPYKYEHTFINMNMRTFLDMKLSTSTDKDLEQLEHVEDTGMTWVEEIEKELVL